MAGAAFTVTATLIFPADVPRGADGVAVIRALAIVGEDAPALEIARLTESVRGLEPGPSGPYHLQGSLAEGAARHSIEGSVDLDGDDSIGVGDLLTVQNYPLRPGSQEVQLRLRTVGT